MIMSSDNSSEEEEKLKEAIDQSFLREDLYSNDKTKKQSGNSPKPMISKRNHKRQDSALNPLSIKVTPEFQRHVSRHLSKLLDEIIDDTSIVLKRKRHDSSHSTCGIKLLCSSKNYLTCNSDDKKFMKVKKNCLDAVDCDEFERKAKEVAVTPEWVLSQEETKHWAPNTKGDIEIVKFQYFCNRKTSKKKNRKKHTNKI